MNRPLAFALGLICAALCWPLGFMAWGFWKGWRLESVRIVDEDELRKAGL